MITVDSIVNSFANLSALKTAAAALFGPAFIDCNQTRDGAAWTVYLSQSIPNQQALWDNLVNAQDPVYIFNDKTRINADDTDRCTITVNAPKTGALPVVLSVVVNDSAPVDFPIALTAGVGSDYLTCKDPGTIKVVVKNGANRCIDMLTIEAV